MHGLDLAFVTAGIGGALGLVARGVLHLGEFGRALVTRTERYSDLPIRAYVARAEKELAAMRRNLALAPALLYRAKAALADLESSRRKLAALVTSPTWVWRLGTLLVTGR